MANKKPDPKDPSYAQYIEQKQKILLQYAKREIPKIEDDPLGDREIFDRETARFFVCQGDKMKIDGNAKGKYRTIVRTSMF